MSSVSAVTVGNAISSVMVAVRAPVKTGSISNAQLEATLQRLAMQLYAKAHLEAPPSATDFGGGVYNILI